MNRALLLTCFIVLASAAVAVRADDASPRIRVEAKLRKPTVVLGEDPVLTVRVECRDKKTHEFFYGSVPQVFRVDILGDWGPVEEGPAEGSRAQKFNWMHQKHSAAERIKLDRDHPFDLVIPLKDHFPVGADKSFGPGRYLINVKFYSVGLGMKSPIDAQPMKLIVKPRVQE